MRSCNRADREATRPRAQAPDTSEIYEAPERSVRSLAFPLRAPFRSAGGFVVDEGMDRRAVRQRCCGLTCGHGWGRRVDTSGCRCGRSLCTLVDAASRRRTSYVVTCVFV